MLEEFKNAFQRQNNAHVQLILINVAVFLALVLIMVPLTITGFDSTFQAIMREIAIPSQWEQFIVRPWTILTYAFAHDLSHIFHILFNMLALYWFGRLFVEYLGSDKLIAVYVLGAISGALIYLLVYNTVPFFVNQGPGLMVGASAAVNAILVGIATLLPEYTFFLIFLGPIRIKYIAAFYVVLSYLGTIGDNPGGNLAHLGGALMGFIYIKQLQAGNNLGAWITLTIDWVRSLFKPRQRVKVTYRSETAETYRRATKSNPAGISQAEIDAILDKISAGGYESLSKDEKEKLFKASKKQ